MRQNINRLKDRRFTPYQPTWKPIKTKSETTKTGEGNS